MLADEEYLKKKNSSCSYTQIIDFSSICYFSFLHIRNLYSYNFYFQSCNYSDSESLIVLFMDFNWIITYQIAQIVVQDEYLEQFVKYCTAPKSLIVFMLQFLIQDIFDAPKIFVCKQHPLHPASGCIFAVSLSFKKTEFQTIFMSSTIL